MQGTLDLCSTDAESLGWVIISLDLAWGRFPHTPVNEGPRPFRRGQARLEQPRTKSSVATTGMCG